MCDHNCGHTDHDHRTATGRPEKDGPSGLRRTGLPRRTVLTGGAALAASLAGCLGSNGGDSEAVPDPIALTQSDQCDVCGMIIPNHPGPSAEVFYESQTPSGHANPARFCSTWEAFQYDFERQNGGWTRQVFYVTDYSAVDYELITDAGDSLISRHVGADTFVDASDVTFVAGSEVKGAMGRDLVGFSERSDATAFQSEYGGTLVAFDEVTEATIAELAST